jgi:anti-anti-sigma factor
MLIRNWSLDAMTIVDLHGRLGVECQGNLPQAMRVLVDAGRREVVLNLLGVTAVDAAGLGALASAFRFARANGVELTLVVRAPTIRELLTRTKLLGVWPTFPTEAEAIASIEATRRLTMLA